VAWEVFSAPPSGRPCSAICRAEHAQRQALAAIEGQPVALDAPSGRRWRGPAAGGGAESRVTLDAPSGRRWRAVSGEQTCLLVALVTPSGRRWRAVEDRIVEGCADLAQRQAVAGSAQLRGHAGCAQRQALAEVRVGMVLCQVVALVTPSDRRWHIRSSVAR
jgi:hypothetical protein